MWEGPAAPGVSVVGYNVYRSTTSGKQFVKIASRVPGPPYEDRMVVSGQTYFYVVTALDQAGHESRFSGEIRATIPCGACAQLAGRKPAAPTARPTRSPWLRVRIR